MHFREAFSGLALAGAVVVNSAFAAPTYLLVDHIKVSSPGAVPQSQSFTGESKYQSLSVANSGCANVYQTADLCTSGTASGTVDFATGSLHLSVENSQATAFSGQF